MTFPFPMFSPTVGAPPPATDPYFANVVLLLGFEGTDGATTTTDESPASHSPITFNGNAQIDTAQAAVSSTASCLFDGSGDYVSIPDSADWDLSDANSDQFTIEFWMMPHNNGGSVPFVIGQAPGSSNWGWYIDYNLQKCSFNYSSNGGGFTTVSPGAATMSIDAWHFIAVSKNSSGKIRLWLDGAFWGSATPADSSIFNSTGALEIGRSAGVAIYNGWLDEIRITKGICRYDTDGSITVPTAAFPRS